MDGRLLVLVLAGLGGGGTSGVSSPLVRFLGDFLQHRRASAVVLYQSPSSDRFSSSEIYDFIYNYQRGRNTYFAVWQNTSKTRVQNTFKKSTHGTYHVMLSDDDASFIFIDQMNASGLLGEKHRWLILSEEKNVIERWSHRYLPVNNRVTIGEIWRRPEGVTRLELTELYHLAAGLPAHSTSLGSWTPEAGAVSWDNRTVYQRRADWAGLTLRVTTREGLPLTRLLRQPIIDVGGYFGDIWKLLAARLNLNYTVQPSVDGEWGVLDENSTWSGVVGMLVRGEADVAACHLSVTESRERAIDFTRGLFVLRNRLHMKKPSVLDLSWTTYLDSFESPLWATICLSIVAGAAAMAAMYWLERECHLARLHDGNYGFLDTLLHFFSAACQQGAEGMPIGLGTRFFFWTFFITMVTVSAAYSATLVSFLAVQNLVLPFDDLESMLMDGTYQLGVKEGTSQYDYLRVKRPAILSLRKVITLSITPR